MSWRDICLLYFVESAPNPYIYFVRPQAILIDIAYTNMIRMGNATGCTEPFDITNIYDLFSSSTSIELKRSMSW